MARDLLEKADAFGLTDDYLFMTTFRRYTTQVALAEELQKSLEKDGVLVTKEYVKGRANIYTHPGINSYNRVTDKRQQDRSSLEPK